MTETTLNEEVRRLENAKQAIKTSIENKGVTVSSSTRIDGYSALIDQIDTRPTLVGTASEGDVLSGKTFYSNSYDIKEGVMPNRGAVSQSVGYGESYTIPAGYHNGSGTVTNSIGAGTIDVTDLTITPNALSGSWNSTSKKYVVSQASKTATMQSTVTTAGYVSSTVGTKNTGTATVSAPSNLSISQAEIGGSVSNATATVTVAPGDISIANNTSAISGKARIDVTPQTSTTISTGHYIAVKATAAANTTGTTASISGSGTASTITSGYAREGTTTGSISVSGTATGKTSAKDSSVYYLPITDGTISVDGGGLSKGTASGGGLSGGGLSGGGLSLGTATAPTITLSEVASASQDTNIDISKTDIGSKDTTNYPYYFKISGTSTGGGNTVTRAKIDRAKIDRAAFSQSVSRADVNLNKTAGWIEDTVGETTVIPSESTTVSLGAGSIAADSIASDSKTATAANGSTTSYVKLKKASLSASGSISVSGSGTVAPGDIYIDETSEAVTGKTLVRLYPTQLTSEIDKYYAAVYANVAEGSATNVSASGSGTITATVTGEGYVKTTDSGSATLSASGNVSVKSSQKDSAVYYLPIDSGTQGTPTASKGTVSSNQVTVTPSVTNGTGWIEGGTVTGTGVTVAASELVSGNKQLTSQGSSSSPVDVTNYAGAYVRSASSYSLAITDKGSTDITVGTLSSGYYPLSASLTGTLTASTAGWFSSGSATDSSVTVGRIIASSITNNTTLPSGSSSSGTINRGSYIKIGTGYNASDKYYKAQENSGNVEVTAQSGNSVDGYATASVKTGTMTVKGTTPSMSGAWDSTNSKYVVTATAPAPTSVTATAGWVASVTRNAGTSGTFDVAGGTITNNTSGGTSSGTINRGSQIKIGAGYYPSALYYTAQANSGTKTISGSGTTSVDGYLNASVAAGSATTPTASGASTSTSLSGTTLTVARSVTPTVSAGWVSSGTAGTVTITGTVPTEEKIADSVGAVTPSSGKLLSKVTVPSGSATPSATVTQSDTELGEATTIEKKYFSITPKASVGTAGWIASISDGSITDYEVKDGSATTPTTTITANPSAPTWDSTNSNYKITVSANKSITPTISAGWVASGTAGTVTASGSSTLPQATWGTTSASATYTSLAKGTKYKLAAGYYPSDRYYQTQSDPTLSGDAGTGNVLSGKTFYSNSYTKQTGTMTNNGAITATKNPTFSGATASYSYTVPAGYHNGSGTVSGSVTMGNATLGVNSPTITPSISSTYTSGSGYAITGSATTTASVSGAGYASTSASASGTASISGYVAQNSFATGTAPSGVTPTDLSKNTVYKLSSGYYPSDRYYKTQADPTLSGDAAASNVLSGKTFYNNSYTKQTGSMTNNGAVSKTLDTSTTSYTVPAGYHNGSGTVSITLETKSASGAGDITPTSGKVLSKVTVGAGSATTPATTITANPSLSTTYTSGSGYKMSVSTSQNVTPTVSAGWVGSGTAGTITVSGSAYVAQSTWGTTTDSATYTTLAKGTKYKLAAGYYPSARYYQTQSDPTLSGTATEAQVLTGATFYSNNYSIKEGTMANRGAVSASIGYGESYTVPSGFHNGSGTVSNSIGAGTITASGSKTQSTPSFSVSGNVITASVAATSGTATPSVSTAGYVSSSVGTKTGGTFTMSASSNTYTITALTNSTYAGYLTSSTTARTSTVTTISGPTTSDIYIYPSTSINTYWANTYGIKISKPSAGGVTASATSQLYGHTLVVYPSATKTAGYISAGSVSGDSLSFNPDNLGLTERNSLSKNGGTVSIAANSWVADDALSTTVTLADLGYTTKGAQTYTPTTTDQTIASGYALTGAQTIKGSSNLVAGNIKKDVTIFGVTGTYQGLVPSGTYQLNNIGVDESVDVTTYAYAKIKNNATITVYSGYTLNIEVDEGTVNISRSAGTVNADNLSAANIKKGVSILGYTGTYNPIGTFAGISAGTFAHSSNTYNYIAVKSPVACTYKFRCNYSTSYNVTGSLSANTTKNLGTNGRANVTSTSYGAQLVLEGSFTTSNTIYLYAESSNTATATTYSHSFTPPVACKTIIITFAYNAAATWAIIRTFFSD